MDDHAARTAAIRSRAAGVLADLLPELIDSEFRVLYFLALGKGRVPGRPAAIATQWVVAGTGLSRPTVWRAMTALTAKGYLETMREGRHLGAGKGCTRAVILVRLWPDKSDQEGGGSVSPMKQPNVSPMKQQTYSPPLKRGGETKTISAPPPAHEAREGALAGGDEVDTKPVIAWGMKPEEMAIGRAIIHALHGAGEIVAHGGGIVRIRFESGEKDLNVQLVRAKLRMATMPS